MKIRTVVSLLAGLSFALGMQARGQGFVITTAAGGGLPATPAQALTVSLFAPQGLAVDLKGNLYFLSGNAVFRVDATGTMIRIAGRPGAAGFSGDGGAATSAQLNSPYAPQWGGLACDADGNVYIADAGNHRVRKVTPSGIISTAAGIGSPGDSGDGGPATSAQLSSPTSLVFDTAGNLYVADSGSYRVRKITPAGIITAVAGGGSSGLGDGGPATSASLGSPAALAFDTVGNLYIADSQSNRIRMVTPAGTISTAAGNGTSGYSGDGGPATVAQLKSPQGLAFDASGNFYITDSENNCIRKVTPTGIISTVAATSGKLSLPSGLAFDSAGNLYIADSYNFCIRKMTPSGTVSTVAGNGSFGYSADGGPATSVPLDNPQALAFDAAGNLFFPDYDFGRVRKVTPAGIVSTVAGTGTSGYSGDGGRATSAQLNRPAALAFDAVGNLYISDFFNQCIRKVTPGGIISTVAGNGTAGYSGDGGPATNAQIHYPEGLAVDSAGNLYIADLLNHRIRKVTPVGTISTVVGSGIAGYSGDGGSAISAQINGPEGLAVDTSGNLYFGDTGNNRIRKVTPGGIISTVVGNGVAGYSGDGGAATNAQVVSSFGLTFDLAGNLYIADGGNRRVRKVTPEGIISTVAGNGGFGYSGDGGPATSAQISGATGIAFDAAGNLFVSAYAGAASSVVRLLVPQSTRPVLAITMTHAESFTQGDTGQTYSIVVTNAQTAGPTTGTVTVTEAVPTGLSLISMTGSGWTCSGNSCTRSDALAQNTSYPPITVSVNVDAAAPIQLDNQATLTGGGVVYPLYAFDTTTINPTASSTCTYSLSPTSQFFPFAGGSGTITITTQSGCAWSVTNTLTWVTLTTSAAGTGTGTLGFQVAQGADAARTGTLTIAGQTFTLTQNGIGTGSCTYTINPADQSFPASGGTGTITVTTQAGCAWSVTNSLSWVSLTSSSSGTGTGTLNFQVSANSGADRSGTFTVAGQTFKVEQVAAGTSQFTSQALFPHFASGGGWNTRLILINTGLTPITARLNFFADAGTPIALPLNLPQTTGTAPLLASTLERTIAAGATLVIDTASADPLSQTGWVQVLATGTVAGYDNFRLSTDNGFREVFLLIQSASANTLLLPFDHTAGYGTGIAVANASTASSSVGVTIRDESGNLILTTTVSVPTQGHKSFDLSTDYPAAAGIRGTIEFDGSGLGGIGALGVRYGSNAEIAAVVPIVK